MFICKIFKKDRISLKVNFLRKRTKYSKNTQNLQKQALKIFTWRWHAPAETWRCWWGRWSAPAWTGVACCGWGRCQTTCRLLYSLTTKTFIKKNIKNNLVHVQQHLEKKGGQYSHKFNQSNSWRLFIKPQRLSSTVLDSM